MMWDADATRETEEEDALATAARLLGFPLAVTLGPGEPEVGADFLRIGLEHTFGGVWQRSGLDLRSRALISVTIAAVLGTPQPLGGQLRIALNSGVTKEEIVELFIHVQAYAGASRAVEGYQIAKAIFAERAE
jgi:alkylhydroperoxidase/carboxymuconolactone decarboxylase family protein YurZ